MESLIELYRIGTGPSSSHTMGPQFAAELIFGHFPQAVSFTATLYGSLAKTGKGHLTDQIIVQTLQPKPAKIVFDTATATVPHPNTLDLTAHMPDGDKSWRVLSLGGGRIKIEPIGDATVPVQGAESKSKTIYPHKNFAEIKHFCKQNNINLPQYVRQFEGDHITDYLTEVWQTMKNAIWTGISTSGTLQGGLGLSRKASQLYNMHHDNECQENRQSRLICSYAFAVSEQNASGGKIVTAPTCGASGIVPSVLYYFQQKYGFSENKIIDALATAGIIGNIIKTNASISGAECGCQAEVGSACAMAAAALCQLFDFSFKKIDYAAEMALEHHLGLTCDPICGLVQIPCIERNAVAAMRAINAYSLASFLSDVNLIRFDDIVKVMYDTGKDLNEGYRETSESGLAKLYLEHLKLHE